MRSCITAALRVVVVLLSATLPAATWTAAPAAAQSKPLALGDTLAGSITVPGQTDSYTFAATGGERVLVRMSRQNGFLWPRLHFFGESGDLSAPGDCRGVGRIQIALFRPATVEWVFRADDRD